MPDDFFRVDRLAVYDGRHLAVGAARVKADAAAVRMAADLSGLLVGSREMSLVGNYDLKGTLIDILHKADVKFPLPTRAVFVLHTLCDRVVAAEGNFPAADAPEKHLDKALCVTVVGFGKFRTAELCFKHGGQTVFAFDCDFERAFRACLIRAGPDAEGDEIRI